MSTALDMDPPTITRYLPGFRQVRGVVATLPKALETLGVTEPVIGLETERQLNTTVCLYGHEQHASGGRWWCGTARVEWAFCQAIHGRHGWEESSRGPVIARREDGRLEVMWPQ